MEFKMKRIGIMLVVLLIAALAVGCEYQPDTSSTRVESKAMEDNLQEANRAVGMPRIDDFYEKKLAKQIFELRDNSDLITYAYMTNLDGKFIYMGRCYGFGLPYSVQYTNPMKLVDDYIGNSDSNTFSERRWADFTIPQADPNGLYMPEGLSATWLVLINEETGEPEIVYTEPSIVVTQSKLPRRLVAEWSLPDNY